MLQSSLHIRIQPCSIKGRRVQVISNPEAYLSRGSVIFEWPHASEWVKQDCYAKFYTASQELK